MELIFSEAVDVMHPYCEGTWAEFGVFKGATVSLAARWRTKFCGAAVGPGVCMYAVYNSMLSTYAINPSVCYQPPSHASLSSSIPLSLPTIPVSPTNTVYGFDTFTGLPGDWHFFKSGDFSLDGQLPDVPENVELWKVRVCF